jgi:hypothetical protein
VISHGRRQIEHFNVTKHPTGTWIVQQLRDRAPKYLVVVRQNFAVVKFLPLDVLLGSISRTESADLLSK